jgi:hypothetical protein
MVPVEHDLVKDLVPVQIDRAAADLAAKDGDAVRLAIVDVNLLGEILVVPDADIGFARG